MSSSFSKTNGLPAEMDENFAKKLTSEINKIEFLWNKKHKDHKDQQKAQQAWPKVRELLEQGALRVLQNASKQYAELTLKCLELSYFVGKNKKNRLRMVQCGFIPAALKVFRTFFSNKWDSLTTLTIKICLHAVALMRILTRTKTGREQLGACKALPALKQAIEDSLKREPGGKSDKCTSLIKQLDTIICAICIRCLPLKELPLTKSDFPIVFVLPEADMVTRAPAEDASESDEDNAIEIGPGPVLQTDEEKTVTSPPAVAPVARTAPPTAAAPPPRDSAGSSYEQCSKFCEELFDDQQQQQSEGGSPRETAPQSSRPAPVPKLRRSSRSSIDVTTTKQQPEMNKPLKNRCSSEIRRDRNSSDPNPESLFSSEGKCQSQDGLGAGAKTSMTSPPEPCTPPQNLKNCYYNQKTFIEQAKETKHVNIFRKFAYPDFVCAYPCLPLQPFKEYPGALLRAALNEVNRHEKEDFIPKTVYDFDELVKTERDEPELTNNDEAEVGTPDPDFDHLKFEARFENGNLRKVIQVGPYEYDLILNPDINQLLQHHMWYYFQVSNVEKDVPYVFKLVNYIKSQSLTNAGMQPCVFSVTEAKSGRYGWVRCGSDVVYYRNNYLRYPPGHPKAKGQIERCFSTTKFTISFRHPHDICYLAFHYPYTYSGLKASLVRWQKLMSSRSGTIFRKDVIAHSLSGNPIFLLTLTAAGTADQIQQRETIFLSSRVHPGESNGSWMLHGVIEYLLSDAPLAQQARELFIFKIVPFINPDGPINGNHRCSLAGQDLNRQWASPSPILHPPIYACKQLLLYLNSQDKKPIILIDFHGHSRKMNVFMYGCNPFLSYRKEDRNMKHDFEFYLFPELLEDNCAGFSLKTCDFKIQRGKEVAARVMGWRQLGIARSYTIEASYGGFDRGIYAGFQNNTRVLIEVGEKMVDCFVTMKECIECNRTPTKKFESDSDDSGLPDV